jgi:hypothetical protein
VENAPASRPARSTFGLQLGSRVLWKVGEKALS